MKILRFLFPTLLLLVTINAQAAADMKQLFGIWQHKGSGDILMFTPAKAGRVALEYFHETGMSCLAQWQPGEDSSIIYLEPSDLSEYSIAHGRLTDDDGFDKRSFQKIAHLPRACE